MDESAGGGSETRISMERSQGDGPLVAAGPAMTAAGPETLARSGAGDDGRIRGRSAEVKHWSTLGLLLAATAASAGQTIEEDFESGTFGQWSRVVMDGGATIAPSALAAHRGAFGARVTVTAMGGPPEAFLEFDLSPQLPAGESYYVREWVRYLPEPDAGFGQADVMLAGQAAYFAGVVVGYFPPGSGYDAGDPQLAWSLIELYVDDAGTSSETITLYDDGQAVDRQTIDENGQSVGLVRLGLNHLFDGGILGVLDVDDVRTSLTAPLSVLIVEADAGSMGVGECVMLQVVGLASSGVPAPFPYDAGVTVTVSGVDGGFTSQPGCSGSLVSNLTVGFPAGSFQETVWFTGATSGMALIAALHEDFGYVPLTLSVQPPADAGPPDAGASDAAWPDAGATDSGFVDAGPPPADAGRTDAGSGDAGVPEADAAVAPEGTPLREAVGCDCQSAAPSSLVAVLAALLAARRRRTA